MKEKVIPLTEEEGAEFEKLVKAGDIKAVEAFLDRCLKGRDSSLMFDFDTAFEHLMRDAIKGAHYCMHYNRQQDAQEILCSMTVLMDKGAEIPVVSLMGFIAKIARLNKERIYQESERGYEHERE